MIQQAARRVDLMDGARLRRLFLALVPRAEVSKFELRLYVSCYELSRFLAWDGVGLFTKAPVGSGSDEDRVHVVASAADVVCGKRTYILPVEACPTGVGTPKPWLVEVLKTGAELRAFMLANRDQSIRQLAKARRCPGT